MFKYPCKIEKDLDKIRDRMWQRASQDLGKWFDMIEKESDQALKEFGYHAELVGPRVSKIVKD